MRRPRMLEKAPYKRPKKVGAMRRLATTTGTGCNRTGDLLLLLRTGVFNFLLTVAVTTLASSSAWRSTAAISASEMGSSMYLRARLAKKSSSLPTRAAFRARISLSFAARADDVLRETTPLELDFDLAFGFGFAFALICFGFGFPAPARAIESLAARLSKLI